MEYSYQNLSTKSPPICILCKIKGEFKLKNFNLCMYISMLSVLNKNNILTSIILNPKTTSYELDSCITF